MLSNQTVTNPWRVASILMILVPELQWTHTNCPRVLWMSFTSSLLIMKFTVDCLSSSIHHGLTVFPDPWVLCPLFRNESVPVHPRMSLSIPVISESIVSGLLITAQNLPHCCMCIPLLSWSRYGRLLLTGQNLRLLLSWVQESPGSCAWTSHNCSSLTWTRRDCL